MEYNTMIRRGAEISILERPNGRGYSIQQGPAHILISFAEADELAATLERLREERSTPGNARLIRYTSQTEKPSCPPA